MEALAEKKITEQEGKYLAFILEMKPMALRYSGLEKLSALWTLQQYHRPRNT